MSTIDVSDLAHEELAPAKFPVDYHAPFRLFLAPEVHRGIQAHAKEDASVEICGVLVGRWGRDDLGPFAEVTDYIRCDSASSKFAEVTFTHESWAQINEQMDSKFVDKRIIGWYHSHPDFGIFLSDRDCFIHEHFFPDRGRWRTSSIRCAIWRACSIGRAGSRRQCRTTGLDRKFVRSTRASEIRLAKGRREWPAPQRFVPRIWPRERRRRGTIVLRSGRRRISWLGWRYSCSVTCWPGREPAGSRSGSLRERLLISA